MPVPDRSFTRTVVSIGGGGVQNPVVVTGGIDGISGSLLTRRHMPGAVGGGLGDRSRVVRVASARQLDRADRRRLPFVRLFNLTPSYAKRSRVGV